MSPNSAGPLQQLTAEQRGAKKTSALAVLHQAIWEASQFVSLSELERYAVGTVDEIRSDEP